MHKVVIVGVGEVVEHVPDDLENAASPLDLMVAAAKSAILNSGAADLKSALDTIAVVRTTSDSAGTLKSPFGDPDNYPRSVAHSLGVDPEHAIYSNASGHTPQSLVNNFSSEIRTGQKEAVLIVGSEAVANQKALKKSKIKANWRNDITGPLQDQGPDAYASVHISQMYNELLNIASMYSLFENARRGQNGKNKSEYALECGQLFEGFSKVAASHPNAMFQKAFSAKEIATITESNKPVTDIYTRAMVAKDGVNLGASVILMREEKALALGISPDKFIYPLAGSETSEKTIPFRENLAKSIAMDTAYKGAFNTAGLEISDISCMDLYSCFPIAVFAACETLGIQHDDPRGLTVTGGLPFFGGPGNNYSMHGIVNIVRRLREDGKGYGLVGANGGFLSKHAIGIYGTKAPEKGFRLANSAAMNAKIQAQKSPIVAEYADGRAIIESYSVEFAPKGPKRGFVMGRLEDGRRFLGSTDRADKETVQELLGSDPLGREIFVTSKGPGNRFSFSEEKTASFVPPLPPSLEGDFEHVLVRRDGNVLEVTINRPESRNSLTPDANYELEHIFNLYEADHTLWAAILTGAGDKAFCAGNDLKYSATGKQIWVPETGFGGLTSRKKRLKPVIAAVNGFAYGGGLEIAMACDMIVADEAAKFALPEVKTGLIAAAGGVFRLPKAIPHHIAREMILTGRSMGTDEAQKYGLINYIAKPGTVMEKARELAADICSASPTAVSASLLMMYEGADIVDPVDAISAQSDAILKFAVSQDLQAGLMAFLTKQKPKWKNR